MADRIVELDGVQHTFPADATDAEIAAALGDSGTKPSTSAGLALASVPAAANLTARFGTSPTAAKVGSALANGGITLAGVIHGAMTGNIPEVIASPIAGWQAGKGGYWLTKRLQDVARPVSGALEKIAPAASALSGVAGFGDLAQMAEPHRRDIGFLGVGASQPDGPSLNPTNATHPTPSPSEQLAYIRAAIMKRLSGK